LQSLVVRALERELAATLEGEGESGETPVR
jgi:hypothetical protein